MRKHILEHKKQMHMARELNPDSTAMRSCGVLESEKGSVMLVTVVMSAVAIIVTAALIVLVTTGTQISGKHARYADARSAARGCAEVAMQLIETRAFPTDLANFVASIQSVDSTFTLASNITTDAGCTAVVDGQVLTGLAAKLRADPALWSPACNENVVIDTGTITTYDMRLRIGTSTSFTCYAKVASSTEGNTGSPSRFRHIGVVNSGGTGRGLTMPYYYALEVLAEPTDIRPERSERSRLSVLFQF